MAPKTTANRRKNPQHFQKRQSKVAKTKNFNSKKIPTKSQQIVAARLSHDQETFLKSQQNLSEEERKKIEIIAKIIGICANKKCDSGTAFLIIALQLSQQAIIFSNQVSGESVGAIDFGKTRSKSSGDEKSNPLKKPENSQQGRVLQGSTLPNVESPHHKNTKEKDLTDLVLEAAGNFYENAKHAAQESLLAIEVATSAVASVAKTTSVIAAIGAINFVVKDSKIAATMSAAVIAFGVDGKEEKTALICNEDIHNICDLNLNQDSNLRIEKIGKGQNEKYSDLEFNDVHRVVIASHGLNGNIMLSKKLGLRRPDQQIHDLANNVDSAHIIACGLFKDKQSLERRYEYSDLGKTILFLHTGPKSREDRIYANHEVQELGQGLTSIKKEITPLTTDTAVILKDTSGKILVAIVESFPISNLLKIIDNPTPEKEQKIEILFDEMRSHLKNQRKKMFETFSGKITPSQEKIIRQELKLIGHEEFIDGHDLGSRTQKVANYISLLIKVKQQIFGNIIIKKLKSNADNHQALLQIETMESILRSGLFDPKDTDSSDIRILSYKMLELTFGYSSQKKDFQERVLKMAKILLEKIGLGNSSDYLSNLAHLAIERDYEKLFEFCLGTKIGIDNFNENGVNIMYILITRVRNAKYLKMLLQDKKMNRVNAPCYKPNNRITPIYLAAVKGNDEFVKILIDHGADLKKETGDLFTKVVSQYKQSKNERYVKIIELLVANGITIPSKIQTKIRNFNYKDAPKDTIPNLYKKIIEAKKQYLAKNESKSQASNTNLNKNTRATEASTQQQEKISKRKQNNPPKNNRILTKKEQGIFLTAVSMGDIAKVKKMIEKGLDPNQVKGADGTPALLVSIYSSQNEITKLLINKGCDVNCKDDSSYPLHAAVLTANRSKKPKDKESEEIFELLLKKGANPEVKASKRNESTLELLKKVRPGLIRTFKKLREKYLESEKAIKPESAEKLEKTRDGAEL